MTRKLILTTIRADGNAKLPTNPFFVGRSFNLKIAGCANAPDSNTIEFLGIWETLNNPDFNSVEFDGFRNQAGLNSFALTPKQWIEITGAVGISSKEGRYGGTNAQCSVNT